MFPLRNARLRRCLITAWIAWLAVDLFVVRGPLHRLLLPGRTGDPAGAVVARIGDQAITRPQLERALADRLWHEGRKPGDLPPAELASARRAALDDLIDHELLRLAVGESSPRPRVDPEEVERRLERFAARFESRDAMRTALQASGLGGERAFRERLAARLQQEQLLETRIAPQAKVTRDEARSWFDGHREAFALPERVEVRHVFLPTLDHPSEEAKAKLEAALAELGGGKKDFATLARETSEDPASKDRGGALGWMSRKRLPADFAEAVFALPVGKPTLVRSCLGWHLVEVTGRKPAEARDFEAAETEVTRALRTLKRDRAITECRKALRQAAAARIEILAGDAPPR